MEITAILSLIVGLVPVARTLVETLAILQGKKNEPGSLAVIDAIARLSPIAATLVSTIEKIRNKTKDTHAQIWAPIRDDWKGTYAQWTALQAGSV